MSVLQALLARAPLPQRMAVVVAHPDDETIAAGASLRLMPGLLLVHVTDGAPARLDDFRRNGFTTPAAYGEAREVELRAALELAGVQPDRARLRVPDQDAMLHVAGIVAGLVGLFDRHAIQAVLTHAYEGGHPDHDATALATHLAARARGIPVIEFPAYHAGPGGEMEVQRFLPAATAPETLVRLSPAETDRKRAMLDCFHTQAGILQLFAASMERFRPAPAYDFTVPPHPGLLNYERWGWEMTAARWCELARQASIPGESGHAAAHRP